MREIELWLKNHLGVPVALLAGTVIAGVILRTVLFRAVRAWSRRAGSDLHLLFRESLYGPVILWSLMLGLHIATQNSEIPRRYLHYIPPTLAALWILSLSIVLSR